ncbi:ABC transporter ATP-binding protein [Candidatus Parcubacteria bacterium]|nr:ABC transporter ATP-binding protein [Candidatus Parcubacteria bacterium]
MSTNGMNDNNNISIKVENVSKQFLLPHQKAGTLKSFFVNPFSKFENEKQMALDGVSFEIKKGEFFGIVGRNGSGKSTLLKCMAGVYTPDKGHIKVNGSLVPFIELGVGFNPELSGRDNVYLNGALLGFSRPEIDAMYQEIVDFAEIEKFMDQKLKNYSSGMQVRLAFSIAIRAKSDILLLDEVLAVGDTNFQKKCFDYFEKIKRENKTVVLVTHDMGAIEKYCNRAILIEEGLIKSQGSAQEVAYLYAKNNKEIYFDNKLKNQNKSKEDFTTKGITCELMNDHGKESNKFNYGDTAILKLSWKNPEVKNIGVALIRQTGEYVFGANTILDNFDITDNNIGYNIKLDIGEGNYMFKIGFFGKDDSEKLEFIDEGPAVVIDSDTVQKWGGIVKLDHKWRNNV